MISMKYPEKLQGFCEMIHFDEFALSEKNRDRCNSFIDHSHFQINPFSFS